MMQIIALYYQKLKLADFMNFILTVLTNGKADEDVMRLCPVQVGALDQAKATAKTRTSTRRPIMMADLASSPTLKGFRELRELQNYKLSN